MAADKKAIQDYREALLLEAFRLLSEFHKQTVLEFVAELTGTHAEQQQPSGTVH